MNDVISDEQMVMPLNQVVGLMMYLGCTTYLERLQLEYKRSMSRRHSVSKCTRVAIGQQ